jgi:hypothetical protein
MVDASLLNRLNDLNQAINAGASLDKDLDVNDNQILSIQVAMTGAIAGDLTVAVFPFMGDGTTVNQAVLPAVRSTGPTFAAGVNWYNAEYDVSGLEKVRVRVTNNNAGAQTLNQRTIGMS